MELIKTLAEIYAGKTIYLSFTFKDEKFSVSLTEMNTEDCSPPFNINGNIEQINDETFINLLKEPIKETSQLIHNIKIIEEGLKKKLDDKRKKVTEKPQKSETNHTSSDIDKKEEQKTPTLF